MYRDRETERFSFIPWGVDGTLSPDAIEASFIPNSSYIPIQILQDDALSDRYFDRLGELLDTVWSEDEILAEIDRMEALLGEEIDLSGVSEEIEGVRDYVRQRRDNVRDALPAEPDEFGEPFCMENVGVVEASFETAWGTEWDGLDDIMETGDLDLSVVYEGDDIPFQPGGLVANYASEDGVVYTDYASIIMLAQIDAGETDAYILPYVTFAIDTAGAGVSIPLDIWGAEGALLYAGADTEYEFVEAGSLWDGQIAFDEFGTTPGATISGTLSTDVYVWTEVTE